jgi:hypothetical protein
MFARLARYEVPPDRIAEAVENLRTASVQLSELGGMTGGYLLVDHESGMVATLTVWEDRPTLEASRMRASRLRQEAVRDVGGGVASADEFEIAADFAEAAATT